MLSDRTDFCTFFTIVQHADIWLYLITIIDIASIWFNFTTEQHGDIWLYLISNCCLYNEFMLCILYSV